MNNLAKLPLVLLLVVVGCAGESPSESDPLAPDPFDETPPVQEPAPTPAPTPTPTPTPTPAPTPTSTGTMTCAQMIDCMETCQDEACYTACFNQGTAAAQQQMQAIDQCETTAESQCTTQCSSAPESEACYLCVDQACAAQLQACGYQDDGGDVTPTSVGSQSCAQIVQCLDMCNDDACDLNCINQGTALAQQQLEALDQCEDTAYGSACSAQCSSAPDSEACYACLDQSCAAQLQACGLSW